MTTGSRGPESELLSSRTDSSSNLGISFSMWTKWLSFPIAKRVAVLPGATAHGVSPNGHQRAPSALR
jgi:hypothetical protein